MSELNSKKLKNFQILAEAPEAGEVQALIKKSAINCRFFNLSVGKMCGSVRAENKQENKPILLQMRKLTKTEVEDLLKDGLIYLREKKKDKLADELLEHIHVAETRTGARIVAISAPMLQNPENQAMLMALDSREAGGFFNNLIKVLKRGAEVFMKSTYVGYGHKSVGDCGVVGLWIGGLSIVATKQFENWPLFSGQETSTRYVDVTKAGWLNPITLDKGDLEAAQLLDKAYQKLFDFYKKAMPVMDRVVRRRFPFKFQFKYDSKSEKSEQEQMEKQEKEQRALYENTVLAKCCDILGAYLPCGTKTNMSMMMNIRQLGEHLQQMTFDQIGEVAWLAEDCLEFLATIYGSFPPRLYPGQEDYYRMVRRNTAYSFLKKEGLALGDGYWHDYHFETNVTDKALWPYRWATENRPKGSELPKEMRRLGNCRVIHLQDYRSMRDGYRHRDGTNIVPCAVMHFGMEEWYDEQMKYDQDLFEEGQKVLAEIKSFWSSKALSSEYALLRYQYIVPMGYKVPCDRTITFPSMVYYVELRTSTRVHPTERSVAHKVTKSLRDHFPKLVLHVDESKSDWDLKRGADVITEKVQ